MVLATLSHGGCCLLVLVVANRQATGTGIIQLLVSVSQLFTIKCPQLPMSVSWCLPESGTGFMENFKKTKQKHLSAGVPPVGLVVLWGRPRRWCVQLHSPLADQGKFIFIYPAYLSNKKPIAEGRWIPIRKTVENPTAAEFRMYAQQLD